MERESEVEHRLSFWLQIWQRISDIGKEKKQKKRILIIGNQYITSLVAWKKHI